MVDLSRVIGFQWDDGNGRKSEQKHGVSQSEAEQAFFNDPLLLTIDLQHSAGEPRFHALGRTDETRHLMIVFTLRESGTFIRVISARDMSRRERSDYERA